MNQDIELENAKRLYLAAQFDRAFEWFQKLAAKGNGEAMYFLGEFYSQGYGHVAQNLKKGAAWRKKGMAAGDLLATLNAAYNLPQNSPLRQETLQRLFPEVLRRSEAGDVFAQNEVADMYLYGMGTKKSVEQAVYWLEKAGAAGFWRPLNKLGELYCYGEGVPMDKKKGKAYFERAAKTGYGDAEGNLAMCYYNDEPEHMDQAARYLRRAFAHGALYEGDIANILGILLLEGNGVKRDDEESFAWIQRAADRGSVAGMNHLGIYYEKGIGTGKNRELAEEWCKKAADKGHVGAAVQYGIYMREEGNLKTSLHYFKKAAEKGDANGQTWLGSCYLYGIGTKEDKEEARKWLTKAAANGEDDARGLLEELEEAIKN